MNKFVCPNCGSGLPPLTELNVSRAAEASGGLLVQFQSQMRDTGIVTLLTKLKDETLDGSVAVVVWGLGAGRYVRMLPSASCSVLLPVTKPPECSTRHTLARNLALLQAHCALRHRRAEC